MTLFNAVRIIPSPSSAGKLTPLAGTDGSDDIEREIGLKHAAWCRANGRKSCDINDILVYNEC